MAPLYRLINSVLLLGALVFLLSLVLGVLTFILGVLPFYIVFGIVCIGTIAVVFSVMPAGIGTLDLSYLLLPPMAGVLMEVAASVLLIYRFFSILTPFLSTVLLLNSYQLSVTDVRAKMES